MEQTGIIPKQAIDIATSVERLATEINLFFILVTVLFASDTYICLLTGKNILIFNWSSTTFGGALLFLTLYSFTMTVICSLAMVPAFIIVGIVDWAWSKVKSVSERVASTFIKQSNDSNTQTLVLPWSSYDDRLQAGEVLKDKVETLALEERDAFLIEMVKDEERSLKEFIDNWDRMAQFALATLFFTGLNVLVGWGHQSTVSWAIWKALDSHSDTRIWVLIVPFALTTVGVLWSWYKIDRFPITYIKCPPLAREEMKEREKKREEQLIWEKRMEAEKRQRELANHEPVPPTSASFRKVFPPGVRK